MHTGQDFPTKLCSEQWHGICDEDLRHIVIVTTCTSYHMYTISSYPFTYRQRCSLPVLPVLPVPPISSTLVRYPHGKPFPLIPLHRVNFSFRVICHLAGPVTTRHRPTCWLLLRLLSKLDLNMDLMWTSCVPSHGSPCFLLHRVVTNDAKQGFGPTMLGIQCPTWKSPELH